MAKLLGLGLGLILECDSKHSSKRFSSAPEQLIADGKGREITTFVERIEFEFAQSAHRADQGSGNCGGTEFS
jgi:hypothetical protein